MAGRLRRLARRVVLIAAAVGAGFLLAALFQEPAAADGIRSHPGDEPHRQLRALVEPIARLTVAERSADARPRVVRADKTPHDRLRAPLAGAIGGVVAPRDLTPPAAPRRPTNASRGSVPLPRVGATVPSGTVERTQLRPASPASVTHRPAPHGRPSRPAAGPGPGPAPSAADAPALPVPAHPLAPPVPAGSLAVGLITAPLPHVVDIVRAVPIQSVIIALVRVTDALLPPALRAVIPPAAPPLAAPRAPGPAELPVTGSPPVTAVPTSPAPPPVPAACGVARATAAAPLPMFVAGPARSAASTGHAAVRSAPLAVAVDHPVRPVAPVDEDAAGVDNGSTPVPGLILPVDRQSPLGTGVPCALVPLAVESRAPSAIARPG
ncbi:hypothetical protein ACGFIE_25650 [Micromonospora sp. NPDC049275]|uniref:hypothetical protein n=1 Tax=Micromonospora sp. NPDC049275 TaxID=3364268 RepID=UPI00371ADA96